MSVEVDDVTETLRTHAEEIAAFDAQLYPKPWGDGSAATFIYDVARRARIASPCPRIRVSPWTLRTLHEEELGQRRYCYWTQQSVAGPVSEVAGVPVYCDNALTGYKVEVA